MISTITSSNRNPKTESYAGRAIAVLALVAGVLLVSSQNAAESMFAAQLENSMVEKEAVMGEVAMGEIIAQEKNCPPEINWENIYKQVQIIKNSDSKQIKYHVDDGKKIGMNSKQQLALAAGLGFLLFFARRCKDCCLVNKCCCCISYIFGFPSKCAEWILGCDNTQHAITSITTRCKSKICKNSSCCKELTWLGFFGYVSGFGCYVVFTGWWMEQFSQHNKREEFHSGANPLGFSTYANNVQAYNHIQGDVDKVQYHVKNKNLIMGPTPMFPDTWVKKDDEMVGKPTDDIVYMDADQKLMEQIDTGNIGKAVKGLVAVCGCLFLNKMCYKIRVALKNNNTNNLSPITFLSFMSGKLCMLLRVGSAVALGDGALHWGASGLAMNFIVQEGCLIGTQNKINNDVYGLFALKNGAQTNAEELRKYLCTKLVLDLVRSVVSMVLAIYVILARLVYNSCADKEQNDSRFYLQLFPCYTLFRPTEFYAKNPKVVVGANACLHATCDGIQNRFTEKSTEGEIKPLGELKKAREQGFFASLQNCLRCAVNDTDVRCDFFGAALLVEECCVSCAVFGDEEKVDLYFKNVDRPEKIKCFNCCNWKVRPERIAAKPERIAAEPERIAAEPERIAAEPEGIAADPPTI